ncbi:hypothetical protein MRX96_022268 [Rhipicephalus microplus]
MKAGRQAGGSENLESSSWARQDVARMISVDKPSDGPKELAALAAEKAGAMALTAVIRTPTFKGSKLSQQRHNATTYFCRYVRCLTTMKVSAAVLLLLLSVILSECQRSKVRDPNCAPKRYPDLLKPTNCTSNNKTIRHGKTGDTGSAGCLGAYCWYGHLITIPCPFGKPKNNEIYTYTRRKNLTWPSCCYWTRRCTSEQE